MKTKTIFGIISFALLLLTVCSSFAQVPKPGSGRDGVKTVYHLRLNSL